MRSASSSNRRLRSRPAAPHHGRSPLLAIANLVDGASLAEPGHLLVHVADETASDFQLGLKPLDRETHPFSELAGFTAPPDWTTFGMRVLGTVHHLESERPSERSATTFLVHRSGDEASLLRRGDEVDELADRAIGTIPDLCRRVLGLPTDPAPPTTAVLWMVAWLDRILEVWGDPARRSQIESSWVELALLHPAAAAPPDDDLLHLDDPARLIALGRAHTETWPWARLRAQPEVLALPDGDLPSYITEWMDDGFYARWAMGAFPPPASLARDTCALLDERVRTLLVQVMEGLLD